MNEEEYKQAVKWFKRLTMAVIIAAGLFWVILFIALLFLILY